MSKLISRVTNPGRTRTAGLVWYAFASSAVFLLLFTLFWSRTSAYYALNTRNANQNIGTPQILPDNTRFEHLSSEIGLSHNTVYAVLQDQRGFMWFATQDGLNKYDGYQFTIYRPDPKNPNAISSTIVLTLYEDQEGYIWAGTVSGLERFDPRSGSFTHFRHEPDDPQSLGGTGVTAILEDQEGTLWIGLTDDGLDRMDRSNNTFTHFRNRPEDSDSLSDNSVWALFEDRQRHLWVGTSKGLDRFDPVQWKFHHMNLSLDSNDPRELTVLAIREDQAGFIWIGTEGGGLLRFDPLSQTVKAFIQDPDDSSTLSDDRVEVIFIDSTERLWVGTRDGLNLFDRQYDQFTHFQHDPNNTNSLSGDWIRAISEDHSGNLWIGTEGDGLSKTNLASGQSALFRHNPDNPNSLSGNSITAFAEGQNNILWIGTENDGLNRLNRLTGTYTFYQHDPADPTSLSSNKITALLIDHEGILWVGTDGEGLSRFDPETDSFTHYRQDPIESDQDLYELDSVLGERVNVLYEDQSGDLLVGTESGLNRFNRDEGNFFHFTYQYDPKNNPFSVQYDPDNPKKSNSLSSSRIRALYEDQSGFLWIGTFLGGVNRLAPDESTYLYYRHDPDDPKSLSNDVINAIYEDPTVEDGPIWFGTQGGGLNRFDRTTQTFTRYTKQDGLPSDVIFGILGDSNRYLWISSNGGLSRFDPRIETFHNYDGTDGLQGNQFNPGAYYQSPSGELIFGGKRGFNTFYPEEIEDNLVIPPIVITTFNLFNQPVRTDLPADHHIRLAYDENFVSFEFAALDFTDPGENQYKYMLEGLEREWVEAGTRRRADYPNLRPGDYVFRVQGSNNDEVWNEAGATVKITISPPFWETWWFRGIVAFILIGSVFGGYRLRVRNLEVRSRELERQVQQRTHELESLYLADEELYRHLELDRVLQALVDVAVDILHADKSSLMVWDEQRENLVVRVAHGFRPETLAKMSFAPGEGAVGQVALSGEPVIVEDVQADPRVATRITEPENIRAFIHVPIKIKDQVFGVFNIDYLQPRVFSEEEVRLFKSLAQRAALAIENAQLYEQAQELAAVEERQRLARDLHDAVTQTLFSASLIAEVLPEMWGINPEKGKDLLDEIRQLSQGALAEMRTLLLELRPAALAEAKLDDLLQQLATSLFGRTGLPVKVDIRGDCDPPVAVKIAIYRIAQEALNNIVKHADANEVSINLNCYPSNDDGLQDVIELTIQDDGCGFDPQDVPPDHFGLGIMQERATTINASLDVESCLGEGTKVKLVWKKNNQR